VEDSIQNEKPVAGDAVELVSRIVSFINEIGIACRAGELLHSTFLPGIDIQLGAIIYDPARMKHPGDLLHEAGHLSVLPPENRRQANGSEHLDNGISGPAAEMAAIAWSWAARERLEIPPEVLFHEHGYAGSSPSLLENFGNRKYLGVPLLQWMGMTTEPKACIDADEETYPKMKHWLRQ